MKAVPYRQTASPAQAVSAPAIAPLLQWQGPATAAHSAVRPASSGVQTSLTNNFVTAVPYDAPSAAVAEPASPSPAEELVPLAPVLTTPEPDQALSAVVDDHGYNQACDAQICAVPPTRRLYARAESLLWWLSAESVPPLVTSSPLGTPPVDAGVLGRPGTSILFGGDSVNGGVRAGGRAVLGWWLDSGSRLEGEWFGLSSLESSFRQSSDENAILARPFYNLHTAAQDSLLVAYPGLFQGHVGAEVHSSFLGAGIHSLQNLTFSQHGNDFSKRIDVLYGFRYLGLYGNLDVDSSATVVDQSSPLVGTVLTTKDSFRASNSFFGVNFGAAIERRSRRWHLVTTGRLGIGGTAERVTITGNTAVAFPGASATDYSGGLLALPTNMGSYSHGAFALVPQLELKLGFDLTSKLRVTCGYDLIYWSRVVRPGNQISTFVNPTQAAGQPLVGVPGPLFELRETDLWVQGVSTGLEYRF